MKRLLFAVGFGLWAGAAFAQERVAATHEPAAAAPTGFHIACPHGVEGGDIVMPHIVDSKHVEIPWPCSWQHWGAELSFPTWNVRVGSLTIDLAPTKHVFFLALAATLTALLLVMSARSHAASTKAVGHPKGLGAAIEAVILYLRDEVYMPVIGHGGEKYIPFVLTLFFFIYICNVLGLLPYGATATGNVNVTAALAVITFFVVEIAGIRALGKGYIGTIIYWPHDDMAWWMKLPLSAIMTPIELVGKFTKPFALTIRLFANMIAGHIVILSLISLIFLNVWVALGAVPMSLFIMGLELLVTLIQAFIFSLLAAVFIGQIRTAHH